MNKRENPLIHIPEFDGLRGLLAWWVVLGHVLYSFGDDWGDASANFFAVHVFIILSGFVITYLLDVRKESYGVFIARRWFRIYPVYFLLLVICALIGPLEKLGIEGALFLAGNEEQAGRLGVLDLEMSSFWQHFLAHASLLHGAIPLSVLPQSDSTLLSPAWSLSLEWQYYLVAPFIVWSLSKSSRWKYAAFFALFLAAGNLIPGYKITTGFLPIMMFYFVVGIASYYVWKERHDQSLGRIIAWFCVFFFIDQAVRLEIGTLIWLVVFTSITGVCPLGLGVGERVRAFLKHPFLQHLGKRSYPVYIGHMPVYLMVLYIARPLTNVPVLWSAFVVVGSLVGTYVMAEILHRYVEMPGIRLGRRVTESISGRTEGSASRSGSAAPL